MTQRDTFISELYEIAKNDKDVILISADMGAVSLDRWRESLPEQFIWSGIAEQNTINLAAGLANAGKKVYVYFMGCWSARCFEQIRYSCAVPNNPITILSNSVGLGYAPSGPAHNPTEDIAYMRSLLNVEIYHPSNTSMTKQLVQKSYNEPGLRYIRLERKYDSRLDDFEYDSHLGVTKILPYEYELGKDDNIVLVSCGYMLGRCIDVSKKLKDDGYNVNVFDMFKLHPSPILPKTFQNYNKIISVEEQTLSGGFGSIILESLSDLREHKSVLRLGLPNKYIIENGDRDYHLDKSGLSVDSIYQKIKSF